MTTIVAGRYSVYGEIAAGGMAVVHFGRLLGEGGFSRTVAVKRLHAQLAREPEFLAMFLDEAKLASRVRHPNVVPTLDVVREGDDVFVVMEYVHGESLTRIVRNLRARGERVPVRVAAAIATQLLHGLHAAHEATNEAGAPLHIVHRDVSPHNVLIGADGLVRLIDFGVAKAFDRLQDTEGNVLKGKFGYMSPEQVGGGRVDRRSDIWAAGVVLWEMLANRRLFAADTHLGTVQQIAEMDVPAPSTIVSDVPRVLDEVIRRALQRDPAQRFATAREMAMALEQSQLPALPTEVGQWLELVAGDVLRERRAALLAIEGSGAYSAKDSARDLVSNIHQSRATTAPPVAPTAPPKRKSRAPLIAAILGVFVIGGGGAGAYLAKRAKPTSPVITSASVTASAPSASLSPAAEPTCPAGMVTVTPGKFFMGSDDKDAFDWERPMHQVTLGAYCIDRTEVTTEAYKLCSDVGECRRASIENDALGIDDSNRGLYDPLCNARAPEDRGKHPINCVTWEMANEYCRAAQKRLPTEAEWELAARGRDGRRYPWGDDPPSEKLLNACGRECAAWATKAKVKLDGQMFEGDDGWAATAPVGSFPAGKTPFGAEDMVGNVWEWTSDFYAPYASAPAVDPQGPASSEDGKVVRGGAWNGAYASWVRPTFRFHMRPTTKSHGVGFRCAKSLSSAP